MKPLLRTTAFFGLFILFSTCFTGSVYAHKTDNYNRTDTIMKNIDLGCITKKISVKVDQNNGLLIKSKKFVFYVNREQKQVLFVSSKLAFSKGEFECI